MPDRLRGKNQKLSGRQVYEILVREHADMLTAFLRSLVRQSDLVDDLFQETLLVAWRRLGDYDHERPFGPWLRGIATKLVLQQRRRAQRDFLNCDPQTLEAIERRMGAMERLRGDTFRERAARLRTCLEQLPDRMREVVDMAYARGLWLRDIALATGAGEEAVKKRLQRARQMLLQCLVGLGEEA